MECAVNNSQKYSIVCVECPTVNIVFFIFFDFILRGPKFYKTLIIKLLTLEIWNLKFEILLMVFLAATHVHRLARNICRLVGR
jgi:hypothetical protein